MMEGGARGGGASEREGAGERGPRGERAKGGGGGRGGGAYGGASTGVEEGFASVKERAGQLHTLYMSALQEKQARM